MDSRRKDSTTTSGRPPTGRNGTVSRTGPTARGTQDSAAPWQARQKKGESVRRRRGNAFIFAFAFSPRRSGRSRRIWHISITQHKTAKPLLRCSVLAAGRFYSPLYTFLLRRGGGYVAHVPLKTKSAFREDEKPAWGGKRRGDVYSRGGDESEGLLPSTERV